MLLVCAATLLSVPLAVIALVAAAVIDALKRAKFKRDCHIE